jgi:lysophospholipase L1-like esterase
MLLGVVMTGFTNRQQDIHKLHLLVLSQFNKTKSALRSAFIISAYLFIQYFSKKSNKYYIQGIIMSQKPLTPPLTVPNGTGSPFLDQQSALNQQLAVLAANASANFTDLYSGAGNTGAGKWTASSPSYIGLVATRAKIFTDKYNYSGNYLNSNSRSIHVARTNITQIGAAFANWFITLGNGAVGEKGSGDDHTVRASIEYPIGGTIYQLKFNGSTTGTIFNGTTLASDLISITIPAGATFAIREFRVSGANGAVLTCGSPNIAMNATAGDCYELAASGLSDRTGVAGSFASNSSNWSRPVAIFGPTTQPSYACLGDSRCEGLADDGTTSLDLGEICRTVGQTRGYTSLSLVGEVLGAIIPDGQESYSMRASIVKKYCTHIITQYGINDIYGGSNDLQRLLGIYNRFRQLFPNQWFYACTLPGETVGGNPAVTASATPLAFLNTFNNFLRSGFASTDGVFDVQSALQNTATGIWTNPAYVSADGVHESPLGYAAIASSGVIRVQ